jgi:pimeloyl-ACP methyl ester carboxylesterase
MRSGTPDGNSSHLAELLWKHGVTRRRLIQGSAALLLHTMLPFADASADQALASNATEATPYDPALLPLGIRSRFVNVNGLKMHVLEAGFDGHNQRCVVLLHGFPEIAYSWRKLMLPLAAAGFHVIAPDRRGYGRTSGWDVRYDDDPGPFATLNQVRDVVALAAAFGHRSLAAVIGHDFGSPLAAWCAVVRPDLFRSVVMMSAPFAGPPSLPFNTANVMQSGTSAELAADPIYDQLANLNPPRKHYQKYFASRAANENMWHPPQGIHAFLRAYYYMKSADWRQNAPFPLKARTADEWAKLPRYYVMDLNKGMAETVAPEMPSAAAIAACKWLTEDELKVYSGEYQRTGFQGGLEEYRVRFIDKCRAELQLFSGRTLDVPSLFIAGKSDWGVYQNPGDFEKMQQDTCTRIEGTYLVDGAGHWIQQEQPEQVTRLLVQFLRKTA